jgi:serine/threonine protein kinase/formylglycine-generating enzyme required for sulfatase activity
MADHHDEPLRIFSQQAAEQEQMVARFEEAWQRGETPVIDDYVVGDDQQRLLLLVELVHADLECRLKLGQAARVEEYLQRYPDLARDDEFVLMLIQAEYRLRGRRELELGAEEYLARFPTYRERLAALGSDAEAREAGAGVEHVLENVTTDPTALDTPNGGGPESRVQDETKIPEYIGRYRVDKLIGRGGFGVVYLAHDDQLDRPVAIKVPHARQISDRQDAGPYLAEARAAAHLEHTNIVPVYDVGSSDEIPLYIVSKFIQGQNLQNRVKEAPFHHEQSAELISSLAEALHHAHKHGVVHRDVKPGNILVEDTGKAFLVDFGLALRERDFGTGARYAGTPAYMSPEQARGEGHRVDGRSDIFSLGIVFYELLVSRHPFRGGTRAQWMEHIASLEARPPRQIDDSIPKELERICLKALSKRAADRYTTAKDIVDDLRQFLAERHTPAPPPAIPAQLSAIADTETAKAGSSGTIDSGTAPPKIIPKGLRSFDEHDADFFLDLLPGPRDRKGLPESIRFWKTRIEETDPERTFPVGLIYGPSGCGKSSLVKAGLLPHLADYVHCVFVEATPQETESRLLSGVRRVCPDLPRELSLPETLTVLRRGQGIEDGKKVLIVLDQFEQWLHAQGAMDDSPLAQALRQCDGARLQCLCLVRDDFWLAISRFMQDLEIRLVEGDNSALVDLFDPLHARKVLAAFGRAYGRLPEGAVELSKEQDAFLDHAVEGLAQDGKIICVRLALFADMLKGKPWTTTTLSQVGGTEGLGVTFLEETFSSATAPAAHRHHQQAAQAVLRVLLPQAGTDIRGNRQPSDVLLTASGYAQRPREFADLIRILDSEVRLITPAVPEGEDIESASAPDSTSDSSLRPPASRLRHYQLTHDYLVPSLRDWLTRKQRETRHGRAELRLAERSVLWNAKRENRHLPSLFEFANIRTLTTPKSWTDPQRKMMKQACRVHGWRSLIAVLVTLLLAWLGFESYGRVQAQNVLAADPANLPSAMERLSPWQMWARQYLRAIVERAPQDDAQRKGQLHARLAQSALTGTYDPELLTALYESGIPYLGVVRDALQPHSDQLATALWDTLHNAGDSAGKRFRAGLALATYATASEHWSAADYALLAGQLVKENPIHQPQLWHSLQPLAPRLIPDLERLFANQQLPESQQIGAANALAVFGRDDGPRLARLLTTATAAQYEILYPLVSGWPDGTAKAVLGDIVVKQPTDDLPQPDRVARGRQRAGAAISLLRLGEVAKSHGAFQIQDDPESLTQFVHRCRDRGVTAQELVRSLQQASDVHSRFALLLTLGDYSLADIDVAERDGLIGDLTEAYQSDPSSAIHGASGWLLRKWGLAEEVAKVDRTPLSYDETGKREWYVLEVLSHSANTNEWLPNFLGGQKEDNQKIYITFVVFPPGEYLMGSPKDEADREKGEPLHRVKLTRPLAVSACEVTWAQYDPLEGGQWHAEMEQQWGRKLAPDEPAFGVNWFEAVTYCRWLTAQSGWSEADQCYDDPESLSKDAEGNPQQWSVHLERPGFRLPTKAEWENVCRCGLRTTYSFGNDPGLLAHYAWFTDNSQKWSHATGQLRPNLRGLFDMHGNLYEWCHDWYGPELSDGAEDPTGAEAGSLRVFRGGCWDYSASDCRSARRSGGEPGSRYDNLGFRVAVVPSRK